ncbi:hypothetical protein BX600DRAFT_470392 [Xylariales sp. PMI_506]|nr:hypothetical protein BX600DRAFT_470392 [Xylariales sp. PMI_506]
MSDADNFLTLTKVPCCVRHSPSPALLSLLFDRDSPLLLAMDSHYGHHDGQSYAAHDGQSYAAHDGQSHVPHDQSNIAYDQSPIPYGQSPHQSPAAISMQSDSAAYSTLEVAQVSTLRDPSLPPSSGPHHTQFIISQPYSVSKPYVGDHGPEVISPSTNEKIVYSGDANYVPSYVPAAVPADAPPPSYAPQKRKGWCGLSLRATWLVAIAVVVILAAALGGGIGGGLAARNKSTSTQNDSSGTGSGSGSDPGSSTGNSTSGTTPEASNPLSGSYLTALNWTDSSSTQRRTVFYQYNESLFYSDFYTTNNSWVTVNVSDIFAQNASLGALDIKAGTALAVDSPSRQDIDYLGSEYFSITLYYMSKDNYLQELVTRDESLGVWTRGALSSVGIKAASNTTLASVAYYCPNVGVSWVCNDETSLFYQDPDGNVLLATGPGWSSGINQLGTANLGVSLAISPFASSSGKNVTDVSELRMLYVSSSNVELVIQNYLGLTDPATVMTSQYATSNASVEIVVCPADYHSQLIMISKDGSGLYTAILDVNDAWQSSSIVTFTNEDGSSTQSKPAVAMEHIAMDNNGVFYGVSAEDSSRIVAYSWDVSDPHTLTWKENIDIL